MQDFPPELNKSQYNPSPEEREANAEAEQKEGAEAGNEGKDNAKDSKQ